MFGGTFRQMLHLITTLTEVVKQLGKPEFSPHCEISLHSEFCACSHVCIEANSACVVEGERSFARDTRGWKYNIKTGLEAMEREGVD